MTFCKGVDRRKWF